MPDLLVRTQRIADVLQEIVAPPVATSVDGYWSRKKAAEYLHLNRETLAWYLDNLCTTIPDFRQDIRRHPATKEYIKGFSLTPYQMWVAVKITTLMRFLRHYWNGHAYREQAQAQVFKYRAYFSRQTFLDQQALLANNN